MATAIVSPKAAPERPAETLHNRHARMRPPARATPSRRSHASAISGLVLRRPLAGFCSAVDNRIGLFIRTIGITRAEAKLLANLAYNFDRLVFHEKRVVTP